MMSRYLAFRKACITLSYKVDKLLSTAKLTNTYYKYLTMYEYKLSVTLKVKVYISSRNQRSIIKFVSRRW